MLAWLYSMGVTGWLLTLLAVLVIRSIWNAYSSAKVFSKMGIPYFLPIPIIGSKSFIEFFKHGLIPTMEKQTKLYGKVYGSYTFTSEPAVVISDLEMLRDIFVKKFQSFPNRQNRSPMNSKPWKDGLLETVGDHWKHIRSVLSPTFSSGKIKRMPAIQRVSANLSDHLSDLAAKGDMVELKELCGLFSMDVIGAVAFGIDVSSIHNPDSEFVKHAACMMNPKPGKLVMFLFMISPVLTKKCLKWGLFPAFSESLGFLLGVIDRALIERKADMQKHHDFLQLLLESENEGDNQGLVDAEINHGDELATSKTWTRKGLTRDEMESNAFLFLLAGYETVSNVVSFSLFCLANNPECLKEAQEEVDRVLGKKMVTYDLANELTYMEMCISEAIRLYTPGFVLTRCTVEEVEVGGLKLPKNMTVLIPVTVLHKDPDVWPEPDKYDPLRHTSEARAKRHPCSFLPFGMGPRNCIGMRLAQLEVRMAVASVLQRFTPVVCEKTVYPPKLEKFRMKAVDGLWIKFQKRE